MFQNFQEVGCGVSISQVRRTAKLPMDFLPWLALWVAYGWHSPFTTLMVQEDDRMWMQGASNPDFSPSGSSHTGDRIPWAPEGTTSPSSTSLSKKATSKVGLILLEGRICAVNKNLLPPPKDLYAPIVGGWDDFMSINLGPSQQDVVGRVATAMTWNLFIIPQVLQSVQG